MILVRFHLLFSTIDFNIFKYISIENAGDCLLFDETGMHRGAQTKQDRYVLIFIYQNINN